MARDIEEFLRKAAERRQQQKGGGAAKKPPAQPPRQPPRQQPPARQQQPPPRKRPQQPVIIDDVEVVQRRPVQPTPRPKKKSSIREGSVAEHVKSHINTSDIAAHAENLGDRIASVHEQVESRIHKRLDHDLTAIDDTKSVTELPPPKIFGAKSTVAVENLRKMLSDPKSVGQAILVAEILKRPDF